MKAHAITVDCSRLPQIVRDRVTALEQVAAVDSTGITDSGSLIKIVVRKR